MQKHHEILRIRAVRERTGLSSATIYRRIEAGNFPAPISLGGRAVGWLAHEVNAFIEKARIERDKRRVA